MVDGKLVRKLALALPEAVDESEPNTLRFSVGGKAFAWTFLERVSPKAPRIARPEILAVRCRIDRKEMLIDAEPDKFFDDEHYRGYAAVLVRLAKVDQTTLAALLEDGWRIQAPKRLAKSRADRSPTKRLR
jgi:hypothetical protein